ncbi:MAG: hypothetical protein II872_05725 [Clostridia bacterium]|nr:hypothetical protein [Clostridia bacterium]
MKKFLSFLIACIMVFSAVGIVAAEDGEPDPEPEFVRPVEIEAVDENGDPIDGVELQLKDADGNVMETWTANGERTLLLPEGDYTLEGLSAPEGYVVDSTTPITVARLAEEKGKFYGYWAQNYHDNVCQNKKHVGLETFWIEDENHNKTTAYCFNHGYANPSGVEYTAYTATEDALFLYARNKKDDITSDELYRHVMYILLEGKTVLANSDFGIAEDDELLKDYLIYMAIKHYTDPKLFPDGVLQAIINHAHREKMEFPENYINAFNALINPNCELPKYDDCILYFYYPKGYKIETHSYQILISAKRVPTQEVKVVIHPSETFTATLKWNDRSNRDKLRPTPEKLLPKLHLYLGGEEITAQYPNCMTVTDNGDNTYTVKIVNLSDEDLTLKIDSIFGYKASKSSMQDGGTITLTHSVLEKLDPIKPMPPVKPITPPWGGSK